MRPAHFPGQGLRCGDSNGDGEVDVADALFTLRAIFLELVELRCQVAADVNDDAQIGLADAMETIDYLFHGNISIPAPGPLRCGTSPGSTLACETYDACGQ